MHIQRLEARRRAARLETWAALVATSWVMGLFTGVMHATAMGVV